MAQKQDSVCDRLPHLSSKYPWFVAQNLEAKDDYYNTGDLIFYTTHSPQSHYTCRIPELLGKRIRACFHGWVILSNHPHNNLWSLWDPQTCKLIHLPPLSNKLEDFYECCLSSAPDDPTSVFLFTTPEKPTIIFCRLDRKRKKLRWIEMSYAKQLRSIVSSVNGFVANAPCSYHGFLDNPTCCNGKVYALTAGPVYKLVIELDIVVKDKEVVITLLPFVEMPIPPKYKCPSFGILAWNGYIKGSCTDLFGIDIGFEDDTRKTICHVFLFKLDMVSMKWVEMEDLKDATFFIEIASHEDCVFYRPDIASELGGYIHIHDDMRKVMYSYNVKDRIISLHSPPCVLQKSQVSPLTMLEWRLGDHGDREEDAIVVRSVTGDEVEFNSTTDESHLLNVPFDILEMIMELCVGVEYMNFRATCKRCQLVAPLIQWSNETSSKRLQNYSLLSPWLMMFDKHQGVITFTDPMFGEKYFIRTPQVLIGFQIYYSKYGWLLMYKIDGPMVFYNPFTNDIRELPPVPYLESYCFSAPPTSPECIVVGFTSKRVCPIYIHWVGRELIWRELYNYDLYSFCFPTFYGQDLYAMCDDKGIDVFKKMGQEDSSCEVVIDKAPSSTQAKRFLAKCDEHLLQVVVGEFGESIEVFNLNESKREWEKIDGLGNHMIYICNTSCLCIEAKIPEMENKIYFPRLHSENGKIVFYSLETGRYHTLNVEKGFGDFFVTKYHTNLHTWIEPSWS